ncbi:MAG: hypothetical protein HXS52_13145 [Theionarchaea archaeon]|nr:hypothetical protein [Theionarchaea archaeon]MBU7038871.1 hypothetical protein [Theionarchaea archaeon]
MKKILVLLLLVGVFIGTSVTAAEACGDVFSDDTEPEDPAPGNAAPDNPLPLGGGGGNGGGAPG